MTIRPPHFFNELAHLVTILDAGRQLHTAGDIHAPRQRSHNGVEYVVGVDATGQQKRTMQAGGQA